MSWRVTGLVLLSRSAGAVVFPDVPLRTTVAIAQDGQQVVTVVTSAEGRFAATLSPGTYQVTAAPPKPRARCRTVVVVVTEDRPPSPIKLRCNLDIGV